MFFEAARLRNWETLWIFMYLMLVQEKTTGEKNPANRIIYNFSIQIKSSDTDFQSHTVIPQFP